MPNMAYCRFRNTFNDLLGCYQSDSMSWPEQLSEDEAAARLRLITLAKTIAKDYGSEVTQRKMAASKASR